jgi:phage-related baseplate assembly protein
VPEGGGTPPQALLDQVMQEVTVNRPRLLTYVVDILQPTYLAVDVSCNVTVAQGYSAPDVQAAVQQAISDFFSYSRKEADGSWAIDFGKPIYLAKLTSWIMNVPGVANVSFTSPAGDVTPQPTEIPALGTVTINVA